MTIIQGDITDAKTDCIVNAANGKGIMGRGVAGAIAKYAGYKLTEDALSVCKSRKLPKGYGYKDGECYATVSGSLNKQGVKKVYHAVTMEYPGGRTSIYIITQAMRNTLDMAIKDDMKSISIPALGTGVGGLNKKQVAGAMFRTAKTYENQIEISLVDIDAEFISYLKELQDEQFNRANISS
jgi:O-acetyl-ADP-ribose deacetylase (regulator of RNase III)